MNSNPTTPTFFNKPTFPHSKTVSILNGSARRALAVFDTGYRFSASFRPNPHLGFSGSRPPMNPGERDSLSADELDRLLERNLLPRFDDSRPASPASREAGFRPELIELSALLVIVGVVLAKLFVV